MSQVKELFEVKLKNALEQDPLCMKDAGVKKVLVALDIEGEGAWSFEFDDGGAVKMSSGLIDPCQCSVHANAKTFLGVIDGSVNVPMAYFMKKIKIKGDLSLAVKVGLGIQKAIEGRK